MSILKRQTRIPVINPIKAALVGIAILGIFLLGTISGFGLGFEHGRYLGQLEMANARQNGFNSQQAYGGDTYGAIYMAPPKEASDACGITAPLDCVLSIVDSVTAPFYAAPRPAYEMRVVRTATRIVICKDVEREYDACDASEDCTIDELVVLAQDLLDCTPSVHL